MDLPDEIRTIIFSFIPKKWLWPCNWAYSSLDLLGEKKSLLITWFRLARKRMDLRTEARSLRANLKEVEEMLFLHQHRISHKQKKQEWEALSGAISCATRDLHDVNHTMQVLGNKLTTSYGIHLQGLKQRFDDFRPCIGDTTRQI